MDKTPIRKPGEMALVAIKNQSKAVQVFKKPNVPAIKKEKQIILSEESYLKVSRNYWKRLEKVILKYFYFRNLEKSFNATSSPISRN